MRRVAQSGPGIHPTSPRPSLRNYILDSTRNHLFADLHHLVSVRPRRTDTEPREAPYIVRPPLLQLATPSVASSTHSLAQRFRARAGFFPLPIPLVRLRRRRRRQRRRRTRARRPTRPLYLRSTSDLPSSFSYQTDFASMILIASCRNTTSTSRHGCGRCFDAPSPVMGGRSRMWMEGDGPTFDDWVE